MCRARTPNYDPPPEYQPTRRPKDGALYREAVLRARGGNTDRRSTLLTRPRHQQLRGIAQMTGNRSGVLG